MISWWCTALARPWTWEWIPYPGIWLASIVPIVLYVRAVSRHPGPVDPRKAGQFVAGMIVFWLASDWPLGTLGAGYLASAHMTQFLLYTLVAAPLILLGTPEWLARSILERVRLRSSVLRLGRALVASGVIYNVILLTTHAPGTVDVLRNSQLGSFAMDVVWMVAGFILWLPVISPLPEGRASSAFAKMAYLFITTSVVAVIPASFLTFTSTPIYAIYELAPRIGSLTAIEDQQLAGIVMKIATIPIIWSTIAVLWFRWTARETQPA
ncbi:MAG TPA: cytochrome c oxidase assembly protein [Acidimicrobiia bacterium]|nr:cytochrome c oxidase assembly protein [Acidimicrobiia bacterium]